MLFPSHRLYDTWAGTRTLLGKKIWLQLSILRCPKPRYPHFKEDTQTWRLLVGKFFLPCRYTYTPVLIDLQGFCKPCTSDHAVKTIKKQNLCCSGEFLHWDTANVSVRMGITGLLSWSLQLHICRTIVHTRVLPVFQENSTYSNK